MSDTEQPQQVPAVEEPVQEQEPVVEEAAAVEEGEPATEEEPAPVEEEAPVVEQEEAAPVEEEAAPVVVVEETAAPAVEAGEFPADIAGIWEAITAQKSATHPLNWIAVSPSKKGEAELIGSGTDGITGLKATFQANEDKVVFAAIRVFGVDEKNGLVSKRAKFVYSIFIGPNCGVMKRARASMQSESIRSANFQCTQYTVNVDDVEDFTPKFIGGRLLNAGGAHKPLRYDFGGNVTINVADLQ